MTDLTPTLTTILSSKNAPTPSSTPSFSPADEFLKEAHRINSHITSLQKYLSSIRHAYLSTTNPSRRTQSTHPHSHSTSQSQSTAQSTTQSTTQSTSTNLTDPERDAIDSSTALLLRDLASSITNLSDAETLRQKTSTQLLHKKFGHSAAGAFLLRWANGDNDEDGSSRNGGLGLGLGGGGKSEEQRGAEEREKTLASVRESVLWFLRRGLEGAASLQRGMVEKRIERVREKEKSVLYKASSNKAGSGSGSAAASASLRETQGGGGGAAAAGRENYGSGSNYHQDSGYGSGSASFQASNAAVLSEADAREIEGQLSAEQLQLFEEENDTMLKHYEDTLGKVQNAEKSLLEISSLQETLVTHLATQEEYISQLVGDVDTTEENIGRGNRELKRATERRSTAQGVFWGTVGLCTWLVVWDLIF